MSDDDKNDEFGEDGDFDDEFGDMSIGEIMDHGDDGFDPRDDDGIQFADPGGRSALRAATAENPRNLPCPTCERPNRLTPADVAQGYQCDACADAIDGP